MMKWLLRWTRVLALLGLLTVALLVFLGYSCQNPPDRARLYVTNIPRGIDFLSLAALRGGRLQSMAWSPKRIFNPLLIHPADGNWSYQARPEDPQVDWDAYGRWEQGERYGVVTRATADDWRITWFDPSAIPLVGHKPLLGGGEAPLDLSQGVSEALSERQLRELGLDKVAKQTQER
jgi:hypothetical protein